MNVLSLFDGISCGQIALNRANIKYDNYYASEIDKNAIKVTQHNYPNTIQIGDVTKINSKLLPKIDLLLGGSPCQGFSFMGNQLNFNDDRSKLFFEYVRLKNELQPTYFLLENVKMKQEYQDIISHNLGVEPIAIDSKLVSAQMRKRLYWTNIPNITLPTNKQILLQDILQEGYTNKEKSYCLLASYGNKLANIAGISHYIKKSVGQLVFDINNCYRKLTPIECERLQTIPDNYTSLIPDRYRYFTLGNGWTVDVIAHILKNIV